MKLSTILLAFVLLDAGNVCAQEVGPEKKATAYMVADAIWILNGIGIYKQPLRSMFGILYLATCFC